MSGRLAGKRAVITGAGSGLGAAIARLFVQEGARTVLTDIDLARAQAVADGINRSTPEAAIALHHDVTREDQWPEVLEQASAWLDGFNVLVNNAGIMSIGSIEDEDFGTWKKVMAVDVDSVFLGCKYALVHMKSHQPGSIINISSIAGLLAARNMAAYNAAKAAVWLLSKSVALHCARAGYDIRSNSLHPAFIRTPILDGVHDVLGTRDDTELEAKLARGIPLGRIGEPEDVAYAAVYLASDESRFITGIEIKIDGGMSAQ